MDYNRATTTINCLGTFLQILLHWQPTVCLPHVNNVQEYCIIGVRHGIPVNVAYSIYTHNYTLYITMHTYEIPL